MRTPKGFGKSGFTLIELIIAMLLSTFVLIGVISVATSMIRYQFESMKRGDVSGLNLVALTNMHRRLENATYLVANQPPTGGGNQIAGCRGFSAEWGSGTPAALPNWAGPEPARGFVYCVNTSHSCTPERTGYPFATCPSLYYYETTGASCPPALPGTCGSAVGGMTVTPVIYKGFFTQDNQTWYFNRDNARGGIGLHYIVGLATPTVNRPNPIAYKVRTRIGMVKSYATND